MRSEDFHPKLGLGDRVIRLLEHNGDFGGPQSIQDVMASFKISNGSARSILCKLNKAGKIERLTKGVYFSSSGSTAFNPSKPHLE